MTEPTGTCGFKHLSRGRTEGQHAAARPALQKEGMRNYKTESHEHTFILYKHIQYIQYITCRYDLDERKTILVLMIIPTVLY